MARRKKVYETVEELLDAMPAEGAGCGSRANDD